MPDTWDSRIARARALAAADRAVAPLLEFYAELLTYQRGLYEFLRTARGGPFDARPELVEGRAQGRHAGPSLQGRAWLPTGSLESDLGVFRSQLPALFELVSARGPEQLAAEAREWNGLSATAQDDRLLSWWREERHSGTPAFFAKAVLQPYAQWLAEAGIRPVDGRTAPSTDNRCRLCGGLPQLSILTGGGELEGGGRSLLCATCLTPWPFRRVLCAWCGEEDEKKLGYFHSPQFDHLRVDACETCRRYLKSVDLTRLGTAVPLIDEVAGAALDVWARERGYEKIELNLLGL